MCTYCGDPDWDECLDDQVYDYAESECVDLPKDVEPTSDQSA